MELGESHTVTASGSVNETLLTDRVDSINELVAGLEVNDNELPIDDDDERLVGSSALVTSGDTLRSQSTVTIGIDNEAAARTLGPLRVISLSVVIKCVTRLLNVTRTLPPNFLMTRAMRCLCDAGMLYRKAVTPVRPGTAGGMYEEEGGRRSARRQVGNEVAGCD
jgi:hypothetical protein